MRTRKPNETLSPNRELQTVLKGQAITERSTLLSGLIRFTSKVGSTCDLGAQAVELTPGASSTCGNGACSCCSCCSW